MDKEFNLKRTKPPIWQHDYLVLSRLAGNIKLLASKLKLKGQTLVDYGSGSSPYKDYFVNYLSAYISVDISKNSTADIVIDEQQPIPLKAKSVDIILSTQVLEHVINVPFYLSECHRLLKKKGKLILSTHGIWPYHGFPDDYNRWTKKGLMQLIEISGFKVLLCYSILGPFAANAQFEMLLLAERLIKHGFAGKLLLSVFSMIGNSYIWLLDKLFPPNQTTDASVYLVLAEKL